MYYCTKRQIWRISWNKGGKRYSRSFKDKTEAQIFELQKKAGHIEAITSDRSFPTFESFADRWVKEYCRVEKAESQWLHDASVLKYHLLPAFAKIRLSQLKKSHLLELKASLRSRVCKNRKHELSPKTINNILGLAKKILNTAVDLEVLEVNPWINVRPLKLPKRQPAFWTPEQRDKFLQHAFKENPEFARIVVVACHTGMRHGELMGLKGKDLDFERGKIHVGSSYSVKLKKLVETVKGKEAEDVPMNQAVKEALAPKRFVRPGDYVFAKILFNNSVRRMRSYAKAAGVPVIRFHDLRHTFASNLAMAGVDLMRIQKLCRHKTYQMTLRYAHLAPGHLAGATEILCTQTAHRAEQDLEKAVK